MKRRPAQNKALPTRRLIGLVAFALLAIFFCRQIYAPETLDYSAFRAIPILHEGRVKPLDSYARIKLKEFSGHESDATAWLAKALFDPPSAAAQPVFAVPAAEIKTRLGLDKNKKLFTLTEAQTALKKNEKQIAPLLKIPPESLTAEQKQILQLYENMLSYGRLLRSFSLVLPLNVTAPGQDKPMDYLLLMQELKTLTKKKGTNPARYTRDEKQLADLGFSLRQIREHGEGNDEFKVIPAGASWISPWQNGDETTLQNWKTLAESWRANDPAAWKAAAKTLAQPSFRFRLEIFYNSIKPFHTALLLYSLSLILFLAWRGKKSALPGTLAGFGLAAHLFGIVARIVVLSRPPVGTLFEAMLFVSLVCAAAAVFRKNPPIRVSGLLAAILLLALAPAMLQTGESMEMLVAVLNTNFWLATHVLCITGGYGLSILAACLAHAFLLAKLTGKNTKTLQQNVYALSLAALLFTAVGTALGGIWADQSWGRFWGWDPKENGALLIVLWLIWLQHGRLGKKLSPLAFAAGTAFLNVIVALAWFGVNLLSVGLHSYGFTSGIAAALFLFCFGEMLIIGAMWIAIRRQTSAV